MISMGNKIWIVKSTSDGIVQSCRSHFVFAPSQWETTLQCNFVSMAGRIQKMIPGHEWYPWDIRFELWNLHQMELCSHAGVILCLRPANERRRYNVTSSQWLGVYKRWSLVTNDIHASSERFMCTVKNIVRLNCNFWCVCCYFGKKNLNNLSLCNY